MSKADVGARGEAAVAAFFEQQGFVVEARNWSCRVGELDLVVARADLLVIVEVRTVSTGWLDSPIRTIDAGKQARVARTADAYLQQRDAAPEQIRFDVVGVRLRRFGGPQIEHVPNAFTPPWAF